MKGLIIILALLISTSSFGQKPEYYLKSGIEKYNSKDFEGAINDYTEGIKVDTSFSDGYFYRGICELALQDYKSAQKDFDKTIELEPKFAKAYFNRALLFVMQQQFAQSLPDLDKTIDLDETTPNALILRGQIKAHTGNVKGACDDFNRAKKIGDPRAEKYIDEFCSISGDKAIYDSMVSEICSCAHTSQTEKLSIVIDSCYRLSIKKNYKTLQKLGIDSATEDGQNKLYNEVMVNKFRLYCKDVYSKFEKEIEKELERSKIGKLTFTGKFISQTLSNDKKYYVLIIQSTQTKEKKEFHSTLFISEDEQNDTITVEYKLQRNKKTNEEEFIVISIEASNI
jgi:tetratricopeptide (TPR) repeat protein